MEETAEGVPAVTALCHAEDLAAECGGGALARRVEGGQRGVDAALQRFRVLQGKQREGGGMGHRCEPNRTKSQTTDNWYTILVQSGAVHQPSTPNS